MKSLRQERECERAFEHPRGSRGSPGRTSHLSARRVRMLRPPRTRARSCAGSNGSRRTPLEGDAFLISAITLDLCAGERSLQRERPTVEHRHLPEPLYGTFLLAHGHFLPFVEENCLQEIHGRLEKSMSLFRAANARPESMDSTAAALASRRLAALPATINARAPHLQQPHDLPGDRLALQNCQGDSGIFLQRRLRPWMMPAAVPARMCAGDTL